MKLTILTPQGWDRGHTRKGGRTCTLGQGSCRPWGQKWGSKGYLQVCVNKKTQAALGVPGGKSLTAVARSPALWSLGSALSSRWLYPQAGSPFDGAKWQLAAPEANLHSYRGLSPSLHPSLNREALLGLDWVMGCLYTSPYWRSNSVFWFAWFESFALLWSQR